MERQEIERQKERKKGGKVRIYNTFLLGCSMNGTKTINLKNRERSQQDCPTEESERNWKFTGIVSFFKSSFLSHPFSYNVETVHGGKKTTGEWIADA